MIEAVAFLGTGLLGRPIAQKMLEAGEVETPLCRRSRCSL